MPVSGWSGCRISLETITDLGTQRVPLLQNRTAFVVKSVAIYQPVQFERFVNGARLLALLVLRP
jgi:hypothetical protein